MTVSPSNRFTVDDIVTYWWVNLGYKYPPVHYYLPPNMPKNHTVTSSSHPLPAVTYNATKKTSSTSEDKPNSIVPSIPITSQSAPPPIVAPLLQVQNGRVTDTESKRKNKINGHQPSKETPRLNDTKIKSNAPTTTNNPKIEPFKINPASRWTLNKKQNNGIPSKNPPTRPIVH